MEAGVSTEQPDGATARLQQGSGGDHGHPGPAEVACQEVEIALLALEDTIDAREAQERQLESRFQLALDQERRRQELEELEQRVEQVYQRKVREKREAEEVKKR